MDLPQNIYDNQQFFDGYADLRDTGTGLNEILEQPALWAMLPETLTGLRILDLGCGSGDFARNARQAGAGMVVGLDCSQKMLERARERTNDPLIQYHQMSLEELSIQESDFDLAVSSLALHYVRDYQAVARKVAQILKPGGRFVFSVEHPICTALPQQQWVRNEKGEPLYWPVDEYRPEGPRSTHWFVEGVIKYHRTIETYVNVLLEEGFRLLGLREPPPGATTSSKHPTLDCNRRRPPFLLLSAER